MYCLPLLVNLSFCFDTTLLPSGRRTSSFQCWDCWSMNEPQLMQKGPLDLQRWLQESCLSWRVKGTAAIANRELWQKHGIECLDPRKQREAICFMSDKAAPAPELAMGLSVASASGWRDHSQVRRPCWTRHVSAWRPGKSCHFPVFSNGWGKGSYVQLHEAWSHLPGEHPAFVSLLPSLIPLVEISPVCGRTVARLSSAVSQWYLLPVPENCCPDSQWDYPCA